MNRATGFIYLSQKILKTGTIFIVFMNQNGSGQMLRRIICVPLSFRYPLLPMVENQAINTFYFRLAITKDVSIILAITKMIIFIPIITVVCHGKTMHILSL